MFVRARYRTKVAAKRIKGEWGGGEKRVCAYIFKCERACVCDGCMCMCERGHTRAYVLILCSLQARYFVEVENVSFFKLEYLVK